MALKEDLLKIKRNLDRDKKLQDFIDVYRNKGVGYENYTVQGGVATKRSGLVKGAFLSDVEYIGCGNVRWDILEFDCYAENVEFLGQHDWHDIPSDTYFIVCLDFERKLRVKEID